MLLCESDTGYKKICIWKDEMPFDYIGKVHESFNVNAGSGIWHTGMICIEAKLNPRHISNYALICMRYVKNFHNQTEIVIHSGKEEIGFASYVLPLNKCISVGLNEEFASCIKEIFMEYPHKNMPCGTIEILCGGYDEVSSSKMSFKKVIELLVFMFKNIDKMTDEELQNKLLLLL